MTEGSKRIGEGGAKDRQSAIEDDDDVPALEKEDRQAVKNQGHAKPEDYPDRTDSPIAPPA